MLDTILYLIVAAFTAWELTAHYLLHNRQGHTLSNRIEWLEREGGWPVRALVAVAVLTLGIHLQGAF